MSLFSQEITFTKAPEDYLLYARDASNTAKVILSGRVKDKTKQKNYVLKVFRDDELYEQ